MKKYQIKAIIICLTFLLSPLQAFGQDKKTEQFTDAKGLQKISLPKPAEQFEKHGDSLLLALQKRASHRSFTDKNLDLKDVSAILWSAYGRNRDNGKRTIPTAMNSQDMLIYVSDKQGIWLYNGEQHSLEQISRKDIRDSIGQENISKNAAIALIYVHNTKKGKKDSYAYMHAGSMYQNAALYCSIADLGNVVRATFPKELTNTMGLPDNQKILIIQNIGIKK